MPYTRLIHNSSIRLLLESGITKVASSATAIIRGRSMHSSSIMSRLLNQDEAINIDQELFNE